MNVSNCYWYGGKVTGLNTVGGFAGMISGWDTSWILKDCYTSGTVEATGKMGPTNTYLGGFAGELYYQDVSNCYSACTVINTGGGGCVGSFAGDYDPEDASVTSCYYDADLAGYAEPSPAVGKTTAEMQTQSTFIGWDFTSIW